MEWTVESLGLTMIILGVCMYHIREQNHDHSMRYLTIALGCILAYAAIRATGFWFTAKIFRTIAVASLLLPTLSFTYVGLSLLILGSGMNLLVVALNNFCMPYAANRISPPAGPTPHYVPISPETALAFLSDIIPLPGQNHVFSIGDVFIIMGIYIAAWQLFSHKESQTKT